MSDKPDIVERLEDPRYRGPLQHLRGWGELDNLHTDAAAHIRSQAAEIERLREEAGDAALDLLAAHGQAQEALDECQRLRALTTWRPMESAPKAGKVLLANYAPTSWAYWPSAKVLKESDSMRAREVSLRYARAWMPWPEPPLRTTEDLLEEMRAVARGERAAPPLDGKTS